MICIQQGPIFCFYLKFRYSLKIEVSTISFRKTFVASRYTVNLLSLVVETNLGAQSNQMGKSGIFNGIKPYVMEQVDVVIKEIL